MIYITTKSGLYKDKPFNVDFDFGTGSHRTRDGSVTVSGQQNNFYYALHGDSHRTSGISVASKNTFRYTSTQGDEIRTGGAIEKDKFHRDGTSLRFGYDDNQKGIDFLASHSSQTFHNDSITSGQDTQGYTAFENLTPTYIRTRETLFKLGGYLGSDEELFKHKASVSHLKGDSDTFGLNATNKDWKKLNANYQLDVNFDREGSVTQAVSLLTDYQRTSFTSKNYNGVEKRLTEKSVAAEYRLFTESDHSLSLSSRFTDNSQYKNAWTGRVAGAYRLSSNFKAHAGIGSAIQNPNLTDYFGWDNKNIGNPDLKPAKSIGGEIGLLMETTNKAHSLDVTYFARNVKDYIDTKYGTVNQAYNRDDKTHIKGVEIVYNGKFTDALTAYANYTYTNIHSDKQYGANYLRRPMHTANAGLAYQITEKLGADANVSYTGKRMDTYYSPTYSTHKVKLPSYTLANLGVNYKVADSLTIYANLNNVFNKKYENIVGYGQDGRNVYVGLKGSF